jgi:hypothetical protein
VSELDLDILEPAIVVHGGSFFLRYGLERWARASATGSGTVPAS